MTIDPAKLIGRSIWTTGVYDIAVSEVLARLIQPGDTVVDGGANVGYMSILMGLCTGRSGELIAFEPHPALFKTLRENLNQVQRQTGFPKAVLHNVALSDQSGNALLSIPPAFDENDGIARMDDGSGSNSKINVPTETLDRVLREREAALVKLDVEGHELAVLSGATETLRRGGIRHLIYEDHARASHGASDLLQRHGYTLFQIGWSTFGPMLASIEDPPICKPYEAPSFLATRRPEIAQAACRASGWRVLRSDLMQHAD